MKRIEIAAASLIFIFGLLLGPKSLGCGGCANKPPSASDTGNKNSTNPKNAPQSTLTSNSSRNAQGRGLAGAVVTPRINKPTVPTFSGSFFNSVGRSLGTQGPETNDTMYKRRRRGGWKRR